jgi:hypothetical protein
MVILQIAMPLAELASAAVIDDILEREALIDPPPPWLE